MIKVRKENVSLDEIPNDVVVSKADVEMKIISKCTNLINSGTDKIVEYLENNSSNNEDNETDSISNCKTSHEELPTLCNSLTDTFEKENDNIDKQISLDDALRNCISIIDMTSRDPSIDSDDIFDEFIEEINENGTTSKLNSKLQNNKRKIIVSKRSNSNLNDDSESNHSCYNGTKKIRKIDNCYVDFSKEINISYDIPRLKPKSSREIAVGIPNIFADQQVDLLNLKSTLEKFVQKGICLSLPFNINKCIECHSNQLKNNLTKRDYDNIACRFVAFRMLKFTKDGHLAVAGYPDPYKNNSSIDMGVWLPNKILYAPSHFNIRAAMKILEDTGSQFCKFVQDENEVLNLNWSNSLKKRKVVWKKCVNGIREMCDVCNTTIFNHHWSCGKCGFVVCVDCFRSKLDGNQLTTTSSIRNIPNKKKWLPCSNQKEHQIGKLNITQVLAGNTLNYISRLMHIACKYYKIPIDCNCNFNLRKFKPKHKPIDSFLSIFKNKFNTDCPDRNYDTNGTPNLKLILSKYNVCCPTKEAEEDKSENKKIKIVPSNKIKDGRLSVYNNTIEVISPIFSSVFDSTINAPHMWLNGGHVLYLLDPKTDANYKLFQEQWKLGHPVLVKDVGKNLSPSLWHPKSFTRDFGNQTTNLINCITGKMVPDQPMHEFWDGFDDVDKRLCDGLGRPMMLKLKDWPTSADFAETLPERFQDLMNCLPLKEYTQRTGMFNLASRLPENFVRPDLGPKMYTAYGNAGSRRKKLSTTNLHLDMSDAVNVMVYVAVTKNCQKHDYNWYKRQALKIVEKCDCDYITKRRVFDEGEVPGALWHIYNACDADSIRDLLNKVAVEQGKTLEQYSDPIHDQSYYLDEYLRTRLNKEYGVEGYTIVQCFGDAVIIPAGAPHQVRNLHNCIKVAEDFVSPENVHQSFKMTQEFRHLTDNHTNHEDKLQIKNILYHAVKDSISVLKYDLDHLFE